MENTKRVLIYIPEEQLHRSRHELQINRFLDELKGEITKLNIDDVQIIALKETDFSDLKLDTDAINIFLGMVFIDPDLGEGFIKFHTFYENLMKQVNQQEGTLMIYSNMRPYTDISFPPEEYEIGKKIRKTYKQLLENPQIRFFGPNSVQPYKQVLYTPQGETETMFENYIRQQFCQQDDEIPVLPTS